MLGLGVTSCHCAATRNFILYCDNPTAAGQAAGEMKIMLAAPPAPAWS